MAILRVEGRNIGDEGFGGSNVRDMETGRMSKEGAAFLTETIKKAIAPIEYSVKTNKVAIALTAKNMAEAIKDNTQEFQEIIQENGEDTQDQLLKLLTMMSDAQKKTGDASVLAIKEVIKQIEKIKAGDPSGKLTETLGLDKQQKALSKQIGRQTVFGAAFKKFTNVDLRTERAMSALSPTKLFGLDPGAGDIITDQKRQLAAESVTSGAQELGEALVETKKEEIVEKATPKSSTVIRNAEGAVITEGIDRISPQVQQVDLLEQILAQLKKMEGLTNSNSSSTTIIPGAIPAGLVSTLAAAVGPALMIGSTVGLLGAAALIMWENWPGQDSLEDGPERTRRTAGGRETTTTAPLSAVERRNMEEFGTIDRDEINEIRSQRAAEKFGYATPEVVDSRPVTELTNTDIIESTAKALESTTPEYREIFYEQNPHLRPNTVTPAIEKPVQSSEPSFLPDIGSSPLIGEGVLSLEARGLTPAVSPTADAVSNMSELYDQKVSNVIQNFNSVTNNTTSGSSDSPIIVAPGGPRNSNPTFGGYLHRLATGGRN